MHSRSPQVAPIGQALLEHGGWKERNPQPCLRPLFHSLHPTGTPIPLLILPCSTTAMATTSTIVGGVPTMALAQTSHTRIRAAIHSLHSDHMVVKFVPRSEEHTSELQSQSNLVCRLLLEKKKDGTDAYCTRSSTRAKCALPPEVT